MSRDFGVTDGHPLYSLHRYRSDVRHMVIFDDLVEKEHHRVRLYVSVPVYEMIRQAETNGLLRIVHHEEIVEGCSEPDYPGAESANPDNIFTNHHIGGLYP